MKRERVAGIVAGLILLCILFIALGMTTEQVWYLWPLETVNGITFSLAFGLGFPVWLGYSVAVLSLLGVFHIGYKLGLNVARVLER